MGLFGRREPEREADRDEIKERAMAKDGNRATNFDGTKTGMVVRWVVDKGYGFIRPDDGSVDFFVHVHGVADGRRSPDNGRKLLTEGDRVEFKVKLSDRKAGKMQAFDVRLVQ